MADTSHVAVAVAVVGMDQVNYAPTGSESEFHETMDVATLDAHLYVHPDASVTNLTISSCPSGPSF